MKKMGYILIALGILLTLAGVWALKREPAEQDIHEDTGTSMAEEKAQPDDVEKDGLTDNQKKGQDFEKYVVSKFPVEYYAIKEWRGDKYDKGRYAESNQYPDLELALKYQGEEHPFAVECKWRSRLGKDGTISWSDDAQIARYKAFAEQKSMPVFVIIGIGGEPSAPSQVYCVPLQQMTSSTVSQDFLKPFYHHPAKDFFYHLKNNTLD